MELIKTVITNPYFKAVFVFAVFLTGARLTYLLITYIAAKWAKKTPTQLDDLILSRIKSPVSYLILLAGVSIGFNFLPLPDSVKIILSKIIASIILIISCYLATFFLNLLTKAWINKAGEVIGRRRQKNLMAVSRKILNFIILTLLVIFILSVWGIKVTALVASLGIAGIVVGLALQTTLANVFGGIFLIADGSFKIGDFVQLDSGESGEIIDVGLRSTRIKSFDEGNEIIIPNSILMNSKIINYGRPEICLKKRIKIGVAYGSDVDKVKKILLECTEKVEEILKNPAPRVYFMEMADFSLNFEVVFWINNYKKRFEAQDKFICLSYKKLQANGIKIPFPTRTIYIEKND